MANRPEMLLKSLWPLPPAVLEQVIASRQFGSGPFPPILDREPEDRGEAWFQGKRQLVLRQPLSWENWSTVILVPSRPIIVGRFLGIALTLLLCSGLIGFLTIMGLTIDATARIQNSERRYRGLYESLRDGSAAVDLEGKIIECNPEFQDMVGYSAEELYQLTYQDLTPEPWHSLEAKIIEEQVYSRGYSDLYEKEYRRKDGSLIPVELRAYLVRDLQAQPTGMWALVRDITPRKRAEEALKLNELRLEALLKLNQMADASIHEITHYAMEEASQLTRSKIGYLAFINEEETVLTMHTWSKSAMAECRISEKPLIYPLETTGLWGEAVRQRQAIITNDYAAPNPWKKSYPEGHVQITNHMNVPIFDGNRIVIVAGVGNKSSDYDDSDIRQITLLMEGMWRIIQRKQATEALRKSEEEIKSIFRAAPIGIGMVVNRIIKTANQRLCEMVGYRLEELLGQSARMLYPTEEDYQYVGREKYHQIAEQGTGTVETIWRQKDGKIINVLLSSTPIDLHGPDHRVTFTALDITARKMLEEERDRLFNLSLDMLCVAGFDGFFKQINPAWSKTLGWPETELLRRPWLDFVHSDDRAATVAAGERLMSGQPMIQFENRYRCLDGSYRWISWNSSPLLAEKLIFAVARDITEKRHMEEQLFKDQRMKAVGSLAGGIAHDFNNLLTAIMGYSEIMMLDFPKEDPSYSCIEEVIKATQRGASLTNQLLAFSRKQILQPRVINLNEVVIDMGNMLQRLIGEDIELVNYLDEQIGWVKADPSQIEQIIMNLAVNARDAMLNGGKLTIKTANVYLDHDNAQDLLGLIPGPQVMLSVSDNGAGMDAATMSNIFEPFFTTKEMGKGTGLGLSTVYGIVKQSGGYIRVDSEPDKGTTFEVFLPQVEERGEELKPKADVTPSLEGNETILVVEDDAALRNLISRALRRYGFKVLEAAHGGEALLICEGQKDHLHLLLTDVVLPQMSGSALAEQVKLLRPEMKVIYMSGYTEDAMVHQGIVDPAINFIPKPFKVVTLVRKVREVLDATSNRQTVVPS